MSIAPHLPQCLPRTAVIGCGAWGKNLVRNFAELGALAGVSDTDGEKAGTLGQIYHVPCLTEAEVLANPGIDAIAIASIARTHFPLAKAALEAGKHVYVEKPMVLRADEGNALCALAKTQGKTLMVGHILHYHPAFIELKAHLSELGPLTHIYANRLGLGRIRRPEGVLWDLATHDVSLILSLVQDMPATVDAVDLGFYQGTPTSALLNMTFAKGVTAHVHVSWASPFKEQKLVVMGEKGVAVFDDCKPWPEKLQISQGLFSCKNNEIHAHMNFQTESIAIPESEPLKNECLHFLTCIQTGETPLTSGEEGLRVTDVLERAEISLKRKAAL